ncbi:MAG: phytanoyl-CoA dioxygenase family protein [Verrucomicrobia bacterium]|nr:phytanoyl-CoA dioxygenase family protein [Verrucomicrobiota bacterium]
MNRPRSECIATSSGLANTQHLPYPRRGEVQSRCERVSITSRHLRQAVQEHGYAVVPEALPQSAVDSLVAALAEATKAPAVSQRRQGDYAMRNLLQLVPAVRALAASPELRALVEPVIGAEAFAVRGLFFDKTPGANWKVTWHQDFAIAVQRRVEVCGFGPWSVKAGVVHVQPPAEVLEKMLTVRVHLDDCDESNGPLQVLPGSHRAGKLSAEEIRAWRARVPAVTCCVSRGGAVLMRPLLLHASSPARQPAHRRVVHLEFAAGPLPGGLEWCEGHYSKAQLK